MGYSGFPPRGSDHTPGACRRIKPARQSYGDYRAAWHWQDTITAGLIHRKEYLTRYGVGRPEKDGFADGSYCPGRFGSGGDPTGNPIALTGCSNDKVIEMPVLEREDPFGDDLDFDWQLFGDDSWNIL